MKQLGVFAYQLLLLALAISAFVIFFTVFPVRAFALDATTQTTQVLPVGGNTCALVSATNFTPYIYDGALHSLEFTVSDASKVAVLGSLGDTPLPFWVMTRKIDAAGMLRIHVDIPTTPISGTLPLKVTLLSSSLGSPVCLTTVSTSIGSGPVAIQNNSVVNTVPTSVSIAPTSSSIASTPRPTSASPAPVPTTERVLTTDTAKDSVVGSIQNPFRNVCASDASAYRLWLILLILYMLIVGALLWAEFPMSAAWARTPERIATIILVLLLLLLTFWYFSISCRAALWMPLAAFLVAVLGLLAAFWNHPRVTQMLLIQETKPWTPTPKLTSTTIITPPPAKK